MAALWSEALGETVLERSVTTCPGATDFNEMRSVVEGPDGAAAAVGWGAATVGWGAAAEPDIDAEHEALTVDPDESVTLTSACFSPTVE